LNDYSIGSLEALSFALSVLNKHFPEKSDGPEVDAYAEIEEAQLKIVKASAVHFKDRLVMLPVIEQYTNEVKDAEVV
jgi:hypothetical protein